MSQNERYFRLLIDIITAEPIVEEEFEVETEIEESVTEEEIEMARLQIQSEWNEEERQRRAGAPLLVKAS